MSFRIGGLLFGVFSPELQRFQILPRLDDRVIHRRQVPIARLFHVVNGPIELPQFLVTARARKAGFLSRFLCCDVAIALRLLVRGQLWRHDLYHSAVRVEQE